MEKLNRAQKCSILGPQNLGSRGGPGPRGPPWIRTCLKSSSGGELKLYLKWKRNTFPEKYIYVPLLKDLISLGQE